MSPVRICSRTACKAPAVFTLTYVYRDSTAVLGPLATYAEPHCYDLCAEHSERLTAPMGWELVRLPVEEDTAPSADDLEALADAVREAARPSPPGAEPVGQGVEVGRRGHLRVLRSGPHPAAQAAQTAQTGKAGRSAKPGKSGKPGTQPGRPAESGPAPAPAD